MMLLYLSYDSCEDCYADLPENSIRQPWLENVIESLSHLDQSAGAAEYTNCISAEG